ncbi:MAG: VPS10 domain-containing protein [Gammaproteobacteria bacterium]
MPKDSDSRITLFVGTKKGLFRVIFEQDHGGWNIDGPHIEGYEILHCCQPVDDPHTVFAAATHPVWGSHIYKSGDQGNTWVSLDNVPHHANGRYETSLKAIWYLASSHDARTLIAGIDPPGLFVTRDSGETWQPMAGLNDHVTRSSWQASKGIFAVHSIYVDPSNDKRMVVAISAGGVYRSDDGGATWQPANEGVRAENLPDRFPVSGHNVHRLIMHPLMPDRLYRQCYNGTYRSDDAGHSWREITDGLPSDFGYAIAADPNDPDTIFQIPVTSAQMRTTVDGKLRVYRSRDGGTTWASASNGLPQSHVYVTVLREAIDTDSGQPCGVYFGTSGGQLFASRDEGGHWELIAGYLPKILSVRVARRSHPQSAS